MCAANPRDTDAEHNTTPATFDAIFGDVMDTAFRVERAATNAAARVAAQWGAQPCATHCFRGRSWGAVGRATVAQT
jgi:hypothetical protein